MVVPIANLSAVVTGAMAVAKEMLPAAVTRDTVVEAIRASAAWFMHHLWAWFAIARAFAVDNLPAGAAAAVRSAAGSPVEASGPWVQTAAKLLHDLYGWLVTAAVENLPDITEEKFLGDAATWFKHGHGVAVYVTLALVLLAVAFLGGAIWALTCRTMKAPGLGGARVPRAVFKANPKLYYATVRKARKACRGACRTGCGLLSTGLPVLLSTGLLVAFLAYVVAKVPS